MRRLPSEASAVATDVSRVKAAGMLCTISYFLITLGRGVSGNKPEDKQQAKHV